MKLRILGADNNSVAMILKTRTTNMLNEFIGRKITVNVARFNLSITGKLNAHRLGYCVRVNSIDEGARIIFTDTQIESWKNFTDTQFILVELS